MFTFSAFLLAVAGSTVALACENPEPTLLHVRLLTNLASDSSKRGSEFSTVAVAPLLHCGEVLIPAGSLVSGTVSRANRVGFGVIRERAALELDFQSFSAPDGRTHTLSAQLTEVDNAREEVTSRGQIKGILAASNANRFFRGVWFKPSTDLIPHSFVGLTGASGKMWSGFGLGPQGAAGLFAAHLILFRFPEPEISLPIGTDMEVRITSLPEDIPSYPAPPTAEVPAPFAQWLKEQPVEVTKSDDTPAEDIINFAFVGTQDQLLNAFDRAGWDTTDPLTSRTFSHLYGAWTSLQGYATAPVFKLYYWGAVPELVFQKSFNSIEKRHHIRIWSSGTFEGNQVWLGAATHDIAITLRKVGTNVNHKIDRQIDLERGKVVEDLAFTDCVDAPAYVDRIGAARASFKNSSVVSDGRMAVLMLRDCDVAPDDPAPLKRPGRKVDKLARRMMLETRQYLMRDNIYYYGFQGAKKLVQRTTRPSPEKQLALAASGKTSKRSASQSNTSFSWTSPVTSALVSPTNTFSSDLIPNSGR